MTKKKSFKELAAAIKADPRRRARMVEYKRAALTAVELSDVREERELRQTDVAGKLGVSQANISRVEGQDDVYLSTLRKYVEALGGTLEINAVFPDQTIELTTYSNEARPPSIPPTPRKRIAASKTAAGSAPNPRASKRPSRKSKSRSDKEAPS